MIYASVYCSPLGNITIVCNGTHVLEAGFATQECGLWKTAELISQNEITSINAKENVAADEENNKRKQETGRNKAIQLLNKVFAWLDAYFAGEKPDPGKLPLAPQGSEFRKLVWQELLKIPYGKTETYGAIGKVVARKLHKEKMSAQAIGGAVGHNPVAVIIPCHRVVGSDGNLTGYAGGLDMKYKLLQHEHTDMTLLFWPKKKKKPS